MLSLVELLVRIIATVITVIISILNYKDRNKK